MKFNHIHVYGSAGGVEQKGDLTAHIIASEIATVDSARALLAVAPDTLAALEKLQENFRKVLMQYREHMDAHDYAKHLRDNQAAVDAIRNARGEG